jgi:hypothetical protein
MCATRSKSCTARGLHLQLMKLIWITFPMDHNQRWIQQTATKLFISLSKELQRGQTNSTMGTIVSPTIGVYSLLYSACECLWTTPAATETFTLFHNSCAALGLICLLRSLNLRQMLWIRTMGQLQGVLCCLFVNFSLLYTRTPFHFSNIKLSHTST